MAVIIILNCDGRTEQIKMNQQRYQTASNFNLLTNNSLARNFNLAPQFPFGFQFLQTIIGNSMMNIDIL